MENELEKVVESAKEAESIGQKTAIKPESLTYETELVKGYISEREKGGLFAGVETSKKTYNTVISPAINSVKSYTDKIKENSRKLTETFEGESSLWQKIVRAWYQISKKSQKEKELLIDTVIKNVERSIGNVDYQIEGLRQKKIETEQYCSQQGELKVDLNDRIDECNDLISKVDLEIEKYRRDGKKLEDSGEYKLRDRLSEEMKKLEKDKNTLGLERRLASDEYIAINNMQKNTEPLLQQVDYALNEAIALKSNVGKYIEMSRNLKGILVSGAELGAGISTLQDYSKQLQDKMNASIGLVSENFKLIVESMKYQQPELFSTATQTALSRNCDATEKSALSKEYETKRKVDDIRANTRLF